MRFIQRIWFSCADIAKIVTEVDKRKRLALQGVMGEHRILGSRGSDGCRWVMNSSSSTLAQYLSVSVGTLPSAHLLSVLIYYNVAIG
jgi:hypothetical protein